MYRVGTDELLKRDGACVDVDGPAVTGVVIADVIVAVEVDDAVVVITYNNIFDCVNPYPTAINTY